MSGSATRGSGRPASVVLLLGTSWDVLEHHNTRWGAVARQWAEHPRIGRLTVVGYPRFRPRSRRAGRWSASPSWLPGTRTGTLDLLLHRSTTTFADGLAWRWAGRQIARGAGRPIDLALAATPLWVPVLEHLGATRLAFDGVDDWREYDAVEPIRKRVDAGYAALGQMDTITVNTATLGSRLGLEDPPLVVPNGVDLERFSSPGAAPDGLPAEPFAVYVGVVQDRVDIELLCGLARGAPEVPVVVAGGGSAEALSALRACGITTLGVTDHALVPGLLAAASVGLIPHRVNRFTESMDPLKLLEYQASGLPVVATPVTAPDPANRVAIVRDAEELVAAVRAAVAAGRGPCVPAPAVRTRGWDGVAERLLDAHLPVPAP